MDAIKFMKWSDALKYTKKNLNDIVEKQKKINSAYQKYLTANPHKEEKKKYEDVRAKLTARILELAEQGYERYDNK